MRELRTVDDQPHLSIDPARAFVEVHRPGVESLAVEDEQLRVQGVVPVLRGRLRLSAAARAAEPRANLVELDAMLQKSAAIMHVPGLRKGLRRRLHRIREYADADPACVKLRKQFHAIQTRHEKWRDDEQ